MSKRKHIPDDELPPKPSAGTRLVLSTHDNPHDFTKESSRLARDRANRALQEIIRLRISVPSLDEKIVLYSDSDKGTRYTHRVTLAELNTLLAELAAILDQAYAQKKTLKKGGRTFKNVERRTSRRRLEPMSWPQEHFPHVRHMSSLSQGTKPAAQLIRRDELLEVKGM